MSPGLPGVDAGVPAEVRPQLQVSRKFVETPGSAAVAEASRCQSTFTFAWMPTTKMSLILSVVSSFRDSSSGSTVPPLMSMPNMPTNSSVDERLVTSTSMIASCAWRSVPDTSLTPSEAATANSFCFLVSM